MFLFSMAFMRRFVPLVWLPAATLLLLFSGCATKKGIIVDPRSPHVIYDIKPTSVLQGKASYYYGRWIGRLTANGETYRAGDITAAHKSLPFHTMVRVTNLKNGKSVIVRINNRGPYVKGRILDLSLAAARKIEMTQAGVIPVRAEVLRKIPVVTKPNEKITPAIKRQAAQRTAQKPPVKKSAEAVPATAKRKTILATIFEAFSEPHTHTHAKPLQKEPPPPVTPKSTKPKAKATQSKSRR